MVDPAYYLNLDLVGKPFMVSLEECFWLIDSSKEEASRQVVGLAKASILVMDYPIKEVE